MRLVFLYWPYPILAASLIWAIAVNQSTGRWGVGRGRRPTSHFDERFYVSYLIAIAVVHALFVFVLFRGSASRWMPFKVTLVVLVLPFLETFIGAVLFFLRIRVSMPLISLGGWTLTAIEALQFRNLSSAALCQRSDQETFNRGLYITPLIALPIDGDRFFTAFEIVDRSGNTALRTVVVDPGQSSIAGDSALPIYSEHYYGYHPLPEGSILAQPLYQPPAPPAALVVTPKGPVHTIRFPLGDRQVDSDYAALVPVFSERAAKTRKWVGRSERLEASFNLYEASAEATSSEVARLANWKLPPLDIPKWSASDLPINQAFEIGDNLFLVQTSRLVRLDKSGQLSVEFSQASRAAFERNRIELIIKVFLDNSALLVVGTAQDPAAGPGDYREVLIKIDADGNEVEEFTPLDSNLLKGEFGADKFLADGRLGALFVRGDSLYLTSAVAPFLLKLGRDGRIDKPYFAARLADARLRWGVAIGVSKEGAALLAQRWQISIYEKRSGQLLLVRPDGALDPRTRIDF